MNFSIFLIYSIIFFLITIVWIVVVVRAAADEDRKTLGNSADMVTIRRVIDLALKYDQGVSMKIQNETVILTIRWCYPYNTKVNSEILEELRYFNDRPNPWIVDRVKITHKYEGIILQMPLSYLSYLDHILHIEK